MPDFWERSEAKVVGGSYPERSRRFKKDSIECPTFGSKAKQKLLAEVTLSAAEGSKK